MHLAPAIWVVLQCATGSVPPSTFCYLPSRSLFFPLRLCRTFQLLCLCFSKGGDLGKEFEQERKTREEMDRIFNQAAKDMKAAGQVRSCQHSLAFTP
jgi:hypothetical protein